MKILLLLILSLAGCAVYCQTITNGDGSALTTRYCYDDISYALLGQPAGGTFTGCGMSRVEGQWYFNPVDATADVTVFPYSCTISYAINNQSVSKSILIYKPVKIVPPLKDTATCNGGFVMDAHTLYAGAYHYQWSPAALVDDDDSSYTTGYIESTQQFVLTAEDLTSGCIGSDTVVVVRNPVPEVTVTPSATLIMSRDSVPLQASGATYYYWVPSKWLTNDTIADPVAYPRSPVSYMVVGMNEQGCSDSAIVSIDITENLFVPNAFTPNGDGINDVFKIENIGYQGVEAFHVFNRWGNLIYETLDGTRGWDGTYKGKPADAGAYYYLIRLGMDDGTAKVFKGEIALLR